MSGRFRAYYRGFAIGGYNGTFGVILAVRIESSLFFMSESLNDVRHRIDVHLDGWGPLTAPSREAST